MSSSHGSDGGGIRHFMNGNASVDIVKVSGPASQTVTDFDLSIVVGWSCTGSSVGEECFILKKDGAELSIACQTDPSLRQQIINGS